MAEEEDKDKDKDASVLVSNVLVKTISMIIPMYNHFY